MLSIGACRIFSGAIQKTSMCQVDNSLPSRIITSISEKSSVNCDFASSLIYRKQRYTLGFVQRYSVKGSLSIFHQCRFVGSISGRWLIATTIFHQFVSQIHRQHVAERDSSIINPKTPKILMLILFFSCYTFPCKLVIRICCQIKITTST